MTTAPNVPVEWSNRNRLTEDSQVLTWTDATVDPEEGQTTTIKVLTPDGLTVLDTITGLAGTSYDIPLTSFGGEAIGRVDVYASRTDADGDFLSLQAMGIYVQVGTQVRATEDESTRLTEGDEARVTE
jgi:hypothetical protein